MAGPGRERTPGSLRVPGFRRRGDTVVVTPASPTTSPGSLLFAPPHRIIAAQSGVAITNTVRAVHWVDCASVQNWTAARGSMEVPAYVPGATLDDSSLTYTFRWWTGPRY